MPRTKLPAVLRRIQALSVEHGLRVGNVFHAGDGNLHPLVLLRRGGRGRGRARRALCARDPRGLRRGRRRDHRRARRRRRQGLRDAADVHAGRPRGDGARAPRVRPRRAREPGQAAADAAPVRRGARARTACIRSRGQALSSVSEPSTVDELAEVLRAATAAGKRVSDRAPRRRSRGLARAARPRARARGGRPHGHGRGGHPPLGAARPPRAARPGARPRPARRPDDRRLPRRRPLRACAATVSERRATCCSASRSCSPTAPSPTPGGTVVKNVAGYDLGKLVCGSAGRYAVIARASLRLHPLPAATASVVVDVDEPDGGRAARAARRALGADPDRLRARVAGPPAAALRGWRGRGRGAGRPRGGASSAHAPIDDLVWDEVRERAGEPSRPRLVPARQARGVPRREPSALVRIGVGSAHVPYEPEDARSPGAQRLAERVREALDPLEVLA